MTIEEEETYVFVIVTFNADSFNIFYVFFLSNVSKILQIRILPSYKLAIKQITCRRSIACIGTSVHLVLNKTKWHLFSFVLVLKQNKCHLVLVSLEQNK